jgi:hypothetical protein
MKVQILSCAPKGSMFDDRKLVIKTEFSGKELYDIFNTAVLRKFRNNKRVSELLERGKGQGGKIKLVTKLEAYGDGDKSDDGFTVIVEVFEVI